VVQRANIPRTGGEILVAALADHGVDTVFGIPGTHNLAVFAAMPDHGIRNITTRHEQGAGYAADGFARSTGNIGVVVTTTGPAALNAAAALAQAYSDSVPVLLIAPGMPTGHPSHGNGLLHELRNQRAALAGVVAESHRVESLAEIPVAVAQAFARMRRGRPRAEYLEVPLDLLDAVGLAPAVLPVGDSAAACPSAGELVRAVEAFAGAQRVLIVAGGGAGGATAELRAVAERLGAAVITTTNGKGALREDHPQALGAGLQHPALTQAIREADVILAVGTEFAPSDWWTGLPELPRTVIRIDIYPAAALANVVPSQALIGDAAATLAALHAELGDGPEVPGDPDWVAEVRAGVRAGQREWAKTWDVALDSLDAVLPEGTVIAADNAMAAYNGALGALTLRRSRSFLFPTGVGTLGFGLPAGIGAKIADPSAPVVVIQGDGGIMFTIQELATAAECRLALPIIVFDNGGYGEIRNEMVDRGDPVHSVALGSPDFVALAESLGCLGVRLTDPAELGSVVRAAFAAEGPTLIHVREESRAAEGLRRS
jgi:thiamine pyrophosphate-dependent acetolactate synthase large subunit-like protein